MRTARFTAWNDQKALLESQGVKLTGINATVAQDLEPEYTTFAADEKMAFVTLQVRRWAGCNAAASKWSPAHTPPQLFHLHRQQH